MLGTEPAWLATDRALLTGSVTLPAEFDIACSTSPSDIPAKSYLAGTLNCVRCSHGIVYPPSPILKIPHVYQYLVYHFPYVRNRMDTHVTVVAANMSRWPTGMIPSEIKAPSVRSTLPNLPLFATPFAGTVKSVKDWSKWAYVSPSTPASACTNAMCISVSSGFAI